MILGSSISLTTLLILYNQIKYEKEMAEEFEN